MYRLAEVEITAVYPRIRKMIVSGLRLTSRAAVLLIKASNINSYVSMSLPNINNKLLATVYPPQRHE
ncbi:hypothetical protein T4C_107 [Trichinella pseudospiralis]|uniref:Uncharacterized protein n=1 Tax=Trichinella pseudospiralis TaxID=6337 RepID=A0A0V1IEY6_TRIPS|nr:hypothetical protein T4C_107 [Trichinella pseudospiralis]